MLPSPSAVDFVPGLKNVGLVVLMPVTLPLPLAVCSPSMVVMREFKLLFKFWVAHSSCSFFHCFSLSTEKSIPLFLSIISAQFEQRKMPLFVDFLCSDVKFESYLGPPSAAAVM